VRRNDAREGSVFGRGRQRDHGFSAEAAGCAAHEVDLTADPGKKTPQQRIGRHLPGEIDRQRRVYRDHPIVARDHQRIVGEVAGPHFDRGVVVHPVVQALAAHHERSDDLARQKCLQPPGDGARFRQLEHAVREHLGVNAEISPIPELPRDGMRNAPDAGLQRRTVRDEARHVATNREAYVVERIDLQREQRHVHGDHAVDVVDVHERIAERARHAGIHFREHQIRGIDCGPNDVDRHAQARIAVAIRRRDLDQDDVDPHAARGDEVGDLRQKHRDEVGATLVHGLSHVGADEECRVPEAMLEPRSHVGRRSQREQMHDFVVSQVMAVRDQRVHQPRRLGGTGANQDAPPPRDAFHGSFRRTNLVPPALLPVAIHVGEISPSGDVGQEARA
jgi:hypothetical protein